MKIIVCVIVAILIARVVALILEMKHGTRKNTRIIQVDHAGKTHWIVENRVLFFFWFNAADWGTGEYKTLEEAQREAIEVETCYTKTSKTIVQ